MLIIYNRGKGAFWWKYWEIRKFGLFFCTSFLLFILTLLYFTLLYFTLLYCILQIVMLHSLIFPKLTFRLFMPFLSQNRQKLIYTHNDNKSLCYIFTKIQPISTTENSRIKTIFRKIQTHSRTPKLPKNIT